MATARAENTLVTLFEETAYAETPTPGTDTAFLIPWTSAVMNGNKNTLVSPVAIGTGRSQKPTLAGFAASGSIGMAMIHGSYTNLWRGLMGNNFTAFSETQVDIVVTPGAAFAGTIATTAGDFSTLSQGQFVKLTAMATAADDDFFVRVSRTVAPTATTLTYDMSISPTTHTPTVLTGQAAGAGTITGNTITDASTLFSFREQFEHTDRTETNSKFPHTRGVVLGNFSATWNAGDNALGQFDWLGQRMYDGTSGGANATAHDGAPTAVPNTEVMDTAVSAGEVIFENALLASCVNSVSLTINRNTEQVNAYGRDAPCETNFGIIAVTGNLDVNFDETNLLADFVIDHTELEMVLPFIDTQNRALIISIPTFVFDTYGRNLASNNARIQNGYPFTAYEDALVPSIIRIDELA